MLPVTEVTASFMKYNIILSAILIGFVLTIANRNTRASGFLAVAHFGIQYIINVLGIGALLFVFAWVQSRIMRGRWRQRFRFTPSSVHYGTAWWTLVSALEFAGALLSCFEYGRDIGGGIRLLAHWTFGLWPLWLWSSITEFHTIRLVEVRLGALLTGFIVTGLAVLSVISGSSRLVMTGLVSRTGSGLQKLNILGTYTPSPVTTGPQTYALLIDMIADGDETLIDERIKQFGVQEPVWIREAQCKLQQIEEACSAAYAQVRSEDRFILYINGHGSPYGSGVIRMADGELTSQKLSNLLRRFPTSHCLVVIDSCFGGKFIDALSDSCNVVVITATDNRNVAFQNEMIPFWKALGDPASDTNSDGRISINEAFEAAFRKMLKKGEEARQQNLGRSVDPQVIALMNTAGYATPQIEVLGTASKDDFSVPVPPKKPAQTRPAVPPP